MDDDKQVKGIQSVPKLVFSYSPMELLLTISASIIAAMSPMVIMAFPWLLGISTLMGIEDAETTVVLSLVFTFVLLFVLAEYVDVKLGDKLGRNIMALEMGVLLGGTGAFVVFMGGEIVEYFLHVWMMTMTYSLVSCSGMFAMASTNKQYKWPARISTFLVVTGMIAGTLFYAILAKEGSATIYTTHKLNWLALGSMTLAVFLAGFSFYRGLLGDINRRDMKSASAKTSDKSDVKMTSV